MVGVHVTTVGRLAISQENVKKAAEEVVDEVEIAVMTAVVVEVEVEEEALAIIADGVAILLENVCVFYIYYIHISYIYMCNTKKVLVLLGDRGDDRR